MNLQYDTLPTSQLTVHPDNPRRGNTTLIAESLRVNGQYKPIVISTDGVVLAGNHTLQAAVELGWEQIETVRVPYPSDSAEAARIVLVDNRSGDGSGYETDLLLNMLEDLGDELEGTGWTVSEVEDLLEAVEVPSLDDLADEVGEHDPTALWPVLRFQVSPEVKARFDEVTAGVSDDDVIGWLLDRAE